ncbi:MAG: site-specific integrase, partial [Firmicutes bacterium]|nr:site-specific integrase [Bacillota bacterium]
MADVYELFEYELYHQGKSLHTVRSYVSKTKHFLRWREQHLGASDLTKVADLDIKRYEAYCRQVKKYTPNSIRQRLSAIRA